MRLPDVFVVVGVEDVEFAVGVVFVVEMAAVGSVVFSVGWVVVIGVSVDVGMIDVLTVMAQDKELH